MLTSAEIEHFRYFGNISNLDDCQKFNNHGYATVAQAPASFIGSTARSRGTWKIVGSSKKFAVTDCYKHLVADDKTIIFTVTKDFDKLKVFPRGHGWLQVNVACGPNGADEPEQVPTFLDDDSFRAVVFGFTESEIGADASYTKDQMDHLIKAHDNFEVRAERYIKLNSQLVQRSTPEAFQSLSQHRKTKGIVIYQEQIGGEVDSKTIVNILGATTNVHFVIDSDIPSYHVFRNDEESTESSTMSPTMIQTEDEHPDAVSTDKAPTRPPEPDVTVSESTAISYSDLLVFSALLVVGNYIVLPYNSINL